MRSIVEKLKSELPELNIHIYDQSKFCNELNGPWNVCFAIGDPKTKMAYTYIIRSCEKF